VRGQGITIAEIDTGVNGRVPELAGRVLSGHDFGQGGNGRIDRDISPFGHGTAMASIMVARTGTLGITGLAPDAKILPIAVPLNGTTEQSSPEEVPAAIRWAADHGAQIINMSIGGARHRPGTGDPCPPNEQHAVFDALAKGAVVIAAVGNTGPRANTVEEPGACLGVVAVGAVDRANAVAQFSARQPYLALDAPGVDVPSLGRIPGQAFSGSGTSQAAALVSATAALVWSRYRQLTGPQLVARLLATVDKAQSSRSDAYGLGVLNAFRAVTARVPTDAPNPVYALAAPFLRRAALLARRPSAPPAPAKTRPLPPSDVRAVRPVAAAGSTRIALGIALEVAGGLALAVLLAAGLRRRRPRVRATASG
jgi:subtilisin family serine protease